MLRVKFMSTESDLRKRAITELCKFFLSEVSVTVPLIEEDWEKEAMAKKPETRQVKSLLISQVQGEWYNLFRGRIKDAIFS